MTTQRVPDLDDWSLPSFYDPTHPMVIPGCSGTVAKILDAARRSLLQYGPERTTLSGVARIAKLSRGAIYIHFDSRDDIIMAVVRVWTDALAQNVQQAVAREDSFVDQTTAAAVVLWRWRSAALQRAGSGFVSDEDEAFLLTKGATPLLQHLTTILRPGLDQARKRKEVRSDLDSDRACEWVVRQLHSLSCIRPLSFDPDVNADLRNFVESYLIRGISTGGAARPKTAGRGRRSAGHKEPAHPPVGVGRLETFFDRMNAMDLGARPAMRDRILDAARKFLVQFGSASISLEKIAQAAGVSRASVYKHFGSSKNLVEAVVDLGVEVMFQDISEAMSKEDSLESQVVTATLVTLSCDRVAQQVGILSPNLRATLYTRDAMGVRFLEHMVDVLRPWIEAAIDRGEVRADVDPTRAAESVARFIVLLPSVPSQAFDSEDIDDTARFVRSFVVRGLQ